MLGFDLARPDQAFEAAASSRRGCYAHYSEPMGIADLDRRVRAALPEEQQSAFDDMANASDPRIENFHRLFYATLRPFRSGGVRIAEGAEIESVKAAVDGFAEEVALSAERFLDMHQFQRVDQLLVTGGGFNVPAVRDALVAKLDSFELQRVYRPVSRLETSLDGRHASLGSTLVRGATALGGASVYFEGLN
jgi:Tfp pilus assembly PilM family ATPase